MFPSTDRPRDPTADALLSDDLADLLIPGVLVEVDAAEAESLGIFAETALTETEAWDANADLGADETGTNGSGTNEAGHGN